MENRKKIVRYRFNQMIITGNILISPCTIWLPFDPISNHFNVTTRFIEHKLPHKFIVIYL